MNCTFWLMPFESCSTFLSPAPRRSMRSSQPRISSAVARYPLATLHSGMDGGDQWLSLTGAEVRVAELAASGMTNRAMAEELIVSPHTVDAHLKHMYAKLRIHSRVELTVLALQHGASTS